MVGIRFLANPVPQANEVIWHHSPPVQEEGAPPPPGEFNLESGMVSYNEPIQLKSILWLSSNSKSKESSNFSLSLP